MKRKYRHYLPKGWTLREVQKLAEYYDNQTDEEGAAEIERGVETDAIVIVPRELVTRVKKMIAESRRHKTKNGHVRRVA